MLQAEAAASPRKMQASLTAAMVQYVDRLSFVGVSKAVVYLADRISQLHEVFDKGLAAQSDADMLPIFPTPFVTLSMPEVRGMGIASALSVAWLRHLRDEACVTAILLTVPWNGAHLRCYAKAGYRVTAVVRYVRLGPWRYLFPLQQVAP